MGSAGYVRRVSCDYRRSANLGSGTSQPVPSDFYKAAMEELAGQGRFYHSGLFPCPGASFCVESFGIYKATTVAGNCWTTAWRFDGDLYGISFRTSESARPL